MHESLILTKDIYLKPFFEICVIAFLPRQCVLLGLPAFLLKSWGETWRVSLTGVAILYKFFLNPLYRDHKFFVDFFVIILSQQLPREKDKFLFCYKQLVVIISLLRCCRKV